MGGVVIAPSARGRNNWKSWKPYIYDDDIDGNNDENGYDGEDGDGGDGGDDDDGDDGDCVHASPHGTPL